MRIRHTVYLLALAFAATAAAQTWELGASGGYGLYKNASVSAGGATATAGFDSGPALSVFGVQNLYKHLSGEFRYTYQFDDLLVSSSGQKVTFTGVSHTINYDLMYLFGSPDSPLRPYVAGGGGIKYYRGTGTETLAQPLNQFAILSKTNQVEPVISVGGGVKIKAGRRTNVYAEFRDYIGPVPQNVVAPVPTAKMSGWLHDIVPMIGVTYSF
ncbi:MAG: outer membrane beta-barrel protein [Bryobacteraceae bacterium]